MSQGRDWDLWRTRLCRLGPSHCDVRCPHAHALSELRAPREVEVRYPDVWEQQQVDRFYGQQLSDDQISLFMDYWRHFSQRGERPSWAVALFLLLVKQERRAGFGYSWDFDLGLDLELLIYARNFDRSCPRPPFAFYPGVWRRLQRRRAAFRRLRVAAPPGGLSMGDARAVAHVADDAGPVSHWQPSDRALPERDWSYAGSWEPSDRGESVGLAQHSRPAGDRSYAGSSRSSEGSLVDPWLYSEALRV